MTAVPMTSRPATSVLTATGPSFDDEVREFLSATLSVELECLQPDTSFSLDLGLSSFDALQLVCDVEDRFGCTIPDDRVRDLQTVGDLITYLEAATPPGTGRHTGTACQACHLRG
jgi:acyl carrier protein